VAQTGKRNLLVPAIVAILLLAAVAVGVLLLHDGRNSAAPVTQRAPVSSRAFALRVLRHNRPRPFSTVLTRMALITTASVASGARTPVAPFSEGRRSGSVGQVKAARTREAAR
jgi:hypothetical protein